MRTHRIAAGFRAVGLGLFAALVAGPARVSPAADPPAPARQPAAWTFDEAVERLALYPRDPYLQYVVLQLGRRDGRMKEAVDAVDRPSLLGGLFGQDRGRRSRADLFATFTGALAIQESLQLDTMRPPGENGQPQAAATPANGQPAPPKKPLPVKVEVAKLVGPTVPSHPWEQLLGGKTADVGPLAGYVPEEFYFAEFPSVARLHAVLGAGEMWAGHIFTQALGDARSQQTAARIKKQLGLPGLAPEVIDRLGVEAVAVVGSDLFLAEGSDVTLLVRGKNVAALARLADAAAGGGATGAGEYAGIAYTSRTTPDRSVNVYAASPRPDLHVRGTSLPAFRRVLETVAGRAAGGRPVRRLGETAEFKYVRTRMPRGADGEDGFVYLSDAFIRHLTGPRLKLTEQRRVRAYNHLRMIGHAALLFRTEHGRPPRSLEELAEAGCAPGVFGKGELAHPDGGTYSLSADGTSGVCSKYGRADALVPCIERPVTEVTGEEAEAYKQFVAEYSQYWRTFFDPIAVRATVSPTRYRLETLVLPLIDNSVYTDLARGAGKPAPLDLLPTPAREVGGLWAHFDKKPLLDALGPETAAKKPGRTAVGPVARVRDAADRARVSNDLKQIGLAFHSYHDAVGYFPTDITGKGGKPLLSWRVAVLPYLDQQALYDRFKLDEPWDSEHNKKLLPELPAVYAGRARGPGSDGKTTFLRPAGKGTAFEPGKKLRIADVTDGTSNTILAVGAAAAVEWTKPADLPVDQKDPLKGLVGSHRDGFPALFCDGSVRWVPRTVEPAELLRAFDPADGQPGELDPPEEPAEAQPKSPFQVQNDLKQIGLAVHNYESANGQLPTTNIRDKAGKPLLSWRVALLPYLGQEALYKQFKLDEPWDSDHNKKLLAKMPQIYAGPDPKLNAAGKTAYLIPSGAGTLSPPDAARLTLAAVTDGLSNTILVAAADPARAVEWTKPADLPFDPKDPLNGYVRPGGDAVEVVMADGATKRISPRIDPKVFAALVTPAGGEEVAPAPAAEASQPSGLWPVGLFPGFWPSPADLEAAGFDLNTLRRFLRDGIGDQVGVHLHDAPRLLDADLSGLFGGDATAAGLTGIGLVLRYVFGPSSLSIPVKNPQVVDEYLAELDRVILARREDVTGQGVIWTREADFYTVAFPKGHTVRCLVVTLAGLKWRLYWGRIGDGLYVATRPFILEDIAAAHAAGARPARTEPAHAALRVRPENWHAVLPGYNLGWAEASRAACHTSLGMTANVGRGWNDRGPVDPGLLDRVTQVYGARPACPDGGAYTLSADGRSCRCSVHGGDDDPRQPPGPTPASATGRLLKSFGGLTASVRFEDDGLRVVVTVDRKE